MMKQKTEVLSEGLEELVFQQFETVTQIEILCHFLKHPDVSFSKSSISQLMFLSDILTTESLDRLIELRFIAQGDRFFQLSKAIDARTGQLLVELCDIFENQKQTIVELLFNRFLGQK